MKLIRIKITSTESWFVIPASAVAELRADYYACNVDGFEKGSKEWQDEYDYSLGDDYELQDWISGSTNPENLYPFAIKHGHRYDEKYFEIPKGNYCVQSDDIDIFEEKENA